MAARKLRPFAEILLLVNSLTDEQKADLLDVLRGKQPKKERGKKAEKKPEKPAKEAKAAKADVCVVCGNGELFLDHQESSPDYHVFRTSLKTKI